MRKKEVYSKAIEMFKETEEEFITIYEKKR